MLLLITRLVLSMLAPCLAALPQVVPMALLVETEQRPPDEVAEAAFELQDVEKIDVHLITTEKVIRVSPVPGSGDEKVWIGTNIGQVALVDVGKREVMASNRLGGGISSLVPYGNGVVVGAEAGDGQFNLHVLDENLVDAIEPVTVGPYNPYWVPHPPVVAPEHEAAFTIVLPLKADRPALLRLDLSGEKIEVVEVNDLPAEIGFVSSYVPGKLLLYGEQLWVYDIESGRSISGGKLILEGGEHVLFAPEFASLVTFSDEVISVSRLGGTSTSVQIDRNLGGGFLVHGGRVAVRWDDYDHALILADLETGGVSEIKVGFELWSAAPLADGERLVFACGDGVRVAKLVARQRPRQEERE